MKPGRKGSIIAMKRHCTIYLPHYMVPDSITFLHGPADDLDRQGRLPGPETPAPSMREPDRPVRAGADSTPTGCRPATDRPGSGKA